MYTGCPQCGTVFRIGAHQVAMARGQVRCGRCGEVFDCVEHLAEDLDDDGGLPPCFHSDRPPTLISSSLPKDSLEEDLFLARPAGARGDPAEPELAPIEEDEQAMAVLQAREPRSTTAGWVVGVLALGAALAAQAAWVERDLLSQDPRYRPWLQQACEYAGCQLPLRKDLDQIQLVSRDIRPHPSVDGALIISATMQNRASFIQPFPVVEIELSDLAGRRIAMRRFLPSEYLEESADPTRGISPGTLLPLVFEVVDPGENAVAFEFSFR